MQCIVVLESRYRGLDVGFGVVRMGERRIFLVGEVVGVRVWV